MNSSSIETAQNLVEPPKTRLLHFERLFYQWLRWLKVYVNTTAYGATVPTPIALIKSICELETGFQLTYIHKHIGLLNPPEKGLPGFSVALIHHIN